jgi:hypothetical protein
MRRAPKPLPKTNTTASLVDSADPASRSTHLTNAQADCNGKAQGAPLLSLHREIAMSALKKFFNRLTAYNMAARQERESLLQQKRERFRTAHNSNTPPPELLVSPPRRLRCNVPIIWFSLMLVFGVFVFVKLIGGTFQAIETRELEARTWVQKLTAKPPVTERDARYQRLAQEVGDLESHSAQELRRIMASAAILVALYLVISPLLLICFFLQLHCLLRSGIVARAEVLPRKGWSTRKRLSFATIDGRQVVAVPSIGPWASIGMNVWILYSPRNPKRVWVYHPDEGFSKLLSK